MGLTPTTFHFATKVLSLHRDRHILLQFADYCQSNPQYRSSRSLDYDCGHSHRPILATDHPVLLLQKSHSRSTALSSNYKYLYSRLLPDQR